MEAPFLCVSSDLMGFKKITKLSLMVEVLRIVLETAKFCNLVFSHDYLLFIITR